MKYVDVVNKYRTLDGMAEHEKQITCWAPFQAMHIDKKGHIRCCPFVNINGLEGNKYIPVPMWSPSKSLVECWNDQVYELMRIEAVEGSLHDGSDGVDGFCDYCVKQCKQNKPPSSLDFDWVGGDRSISHEFPREIELELSNTCNYECPFCSPWCSSQHMERLGLQNDPTYKSIFDDPDVKEAFINDLRSIIHNVYRIKFTGGEPFAQRIVYDILKMIDEEQPENLHLHFTTNGSVMNGATRKLAQRPNTHFTVSLDSLDPETYPTLRVNGNLQNVLNNIDEYIESGAGVGCSFVLSKKNVRELPNIVSWCNSKGIEFSYHILAPMWEELKYREIVWPMMVERETTEYLEELKNYLLTSKVELCKDYEYISGKNIAMYNRYIGRLK